MIGRHINEDTSCKICNQQQENLKHFILACPAYQDQRSKIRKLQQPYPENKTKLVGKLLFEEEGIEDKEIIYKMWKIRMEKLE